MQKFTVLASLLFFASLSAYAAKGQMIAKDYFLKKRAPEVAAELCEGKIILCMGIKRDACGNMFLPAVTACGEKMYTSMPDYISGADMVKKYKSDLRECAWPATREQVQRQIRGNPKPMRKEQCIEFMVPNAPAPKVEEWNGGGDAKKKPLSLH